MENAALQPNPSRERRPLLLLAGVALAAGLVAVVGLLFSLRGPSRSTASGEIVPPSASPPSTGGSSAPATTPAGSS